MRGLLILTLGIFAFTSGAKAEDDVYVDMSVLNSLSVPVISTEQPKFPVVSKEKASRPKVKKAPKAEKVVVNEVKTTPVVEVKEKPIIIPAKPEKVAEPIQDVAVQSPPPSQVEMFVEPEYPVAQPEVQAAPKESPVDETDELSVISSFDDEEVKAAPQDVERAAVADAGEKVVKPLIPATPASIEDAKPDTNKIFFADEDVELTDVKKSLIDSIVSSFVNPAANKIAIYSYNYDNGEDSFKKKRQSLNRAVEIRSYLLGKGFKNFSIKVINVTDDQSKKGVVEIEEIK